MVSEGPVFVGQMRFGVVYDLEIIKIIFKNKRGSPKLTQIDLKDNFIIFFYFACPNCRRSISNSWWLRSILTETLLKTPVVSTVQFRILFSPQDARFDLPLIHSNSQLFCLREKKQLRYVLISGSFKS